MDIRSLLGLDLPARTAAVPSAFLANPKEVELWISHLPLANIGETSRQVYKALVEFNRREIPNSTRLKIAEQFQQPVEYISTNLRKYYIDAPLPLSAKNRKIAALNQELHSELAISYQIIIENIISERPGRFDRKMLIVGISKAMQALLAVIYQSVAVYDAYPGKLWRLIHRIYAYSEQNRIHQIRIKKGKRNATGKSISDLYKELLLFSLSSPISCRQSEIQQIFSELPTWSQLVSLTLLGNTPDDSSGLFISQLGSDSPPIHLELLTEEIKNHCRLLNTKALIRHLQEHFDARQNEERDNSQVGIRPISNELLRKLIHEFSSLPHRKFSRTRLNFELQLAVGLSAVHTLLKAPSESEAVKPKEPVSATEWINGQVRHTGTPSSHYTFSEQKPSLNDYPMGEEAILTGHVSSTDSKDSAAPGWTSPSAGSNTETFTCRTINESAGGYCFDWETASAPKIRIGELVGIRSVLEEHQYSIGITRWMQKSGGKNLHIGVEILSPGSSAVLARLTGEASGSERPHKGLLLSELKTSGQPASLIAPTLPFNLGDIIWIEEGTAKQQVRLTRLLESTGAFAQFQFASLTREGNQPDGTDEADVNFDSIWSTL